MKNLYLPYHISRTLHVPVRKYRKEEPQPECKLFYPVSDLSDEVLSNAVALSDAMNAATPSMPVILSIEGIMAYSIVDFAKTFWLIGPVRFRDAFYFSHTIHLTDLALPEGYPEKDFQECVPLCAFSDFVAQTLLLHNLFKKPDKKGHFLDREAFMIANCVDKTLIRAQSQKNASLRFDNLENGIRHNPYSQELRECSSVREGDLEGLKVAISETFTGQYGQLSTNPLRQEINMGIVTLTLATRAAIEGGLPYETAFTMEDLAIQAMEASKDPETVRHIYRTTEYRLTEHVKEIKSQRKSASKGKENGHITRCKDYISAHLHEPVTVKDIAAFIHIDPSYLSSLFSSRENITLKQYIMSEKIRLVKNMLMYSSYSYIQIATYLGFCSQSHLGTVFKKETGMSLKEFRDTYAQEAFME